MCYLSTLSFLLCIFLLSEVSSLSFIVLLTLIFVFMGVSHVSPVHQGSLTTSLIFLLFLIVLAFLSTSSLFIFFVMYELSLFPVCTLIILLGYQPEKINSILYLLLYTVVCSAPFLYYTIRLISSIQSGISELPEFARTLVCLSFMVKSPIYTLHSWLPKAHVEAPLVGSVLLAGVILKLGRYGLLLLSPNLTSSSSIFVYLTLLGGVVCSLICSRNWDMKSLVAYSSVVHIGVVTLGAISGLELGFWVSCGILVGHSLLSPLLFILAYELYLSSGSRSFIHGHTRSSSCSLLLALSLCSGLNFGLPPFLNFWVEVALFSLQGRLWSLSLLPLILIAFLTFLYSIFFYILACGGPSSSVSQLPFVSHRLLPALIFRFILAFGSSALLF